MAHFAKLGIDNLVTQIVCLDTIKNMTNGGIEKESIGVAFLANQSGHENWKQCSYNTRRGVHYDPETGEPSGKPAFRANYPSVSPRRWYYSSEHDIFYPEKPEDCHSWTLNTTTGDWDPPIPRPELTAAQIELRQGYEWDEAAYQADNTQGWVFYSGPSQMKPLGYNSWVLNSDGVWEAPIPYPSLTQEQLDEGGYYYRWDEAAHQADNTQGWVLVAPTELGE